MHPRYEIPIKTVCQTVFSFTLSLCVILHTWSASVGAPLLIEKDTQNEVNNSNNLVVIDRIRNLLAVLRYRFICCITLP